VADVIASLIARFGIKVESEPLDTFKKKADAAEKSTGGLSKRAQDGAKALAAFGAAAIAAAGQVVQFVEGVVSQNDEIAKTSAKLQMSTDTLQRLRYVAQRSGADVQTVTDAVKDSNKQLFDTRAAGGKSPFADALAALGISLDEFESMNPEQRLGAVGDAIGSLQGDADRTALAMTVFGEAGKELLPLMLSGSEGISAMGDEAERLGGVISGDTLKQSENLAAAMLNVRTTVGGVASQVAGQLMPAIGDIAGRMGAWVEENEVFLQQDLPRILGSIVEVGASVIGFFVDAIANIDDFAKEITDLANSIDAEYGDAIRTAIGLGEDLVAMWGKIANAVARGGLELLEFVGILDDAEETLMKIKLGFGIETEPTTGVRGAPGFLGGPDTANNQRLAAEREFKERVSTMGSGELAALARDPSLTPTQVVAVQTGVAEALSREAQATATAALGAAKAREAADKAARGKAIAARLAEQRRAAAAGGGGSPDKEKANERTTDDILTEMVEGKARSGHGGGESPVAGAQFVRIDASYNAPTTIEITLPAGALAAMNPSQQAEYLREEIAEVLDERNRRAFDHYRQNVRL
jgi:hypothetical protein